MESNLISHLLIKLNDLSGADMPMEQRIFNCAIMISIATFGFAVLFVWLNAWWLVGLGLVAYAGLYSYVFYLSRYRNELQKAVLIFSLIVAVLLNAAWVLDRGIHGATSYYVFVTVLMIIFTAKRPAPYLFAALLNILLLGLLGDKLQAWLDVQIPLSPLGQFLTFVSAIAYVAILGLFYQNMTKKDQEDDHTQLLVKVRHESEQSSQVADNLVQAGDILSTSAFQQKTAIEELLATTEQLSATAEQNNQLALDSISALRKAEMQISESKNNADLLLHYVDDIKQSGREIQNINNVIDDIAWQTNLLSLNAMIEASRAGDGHGGFRVVALEVKRLAEGAAEAAEKINKLLAKNLQSVQKGVDSAVELQVAFDSLINEIKPLSISVRSMSDSSIEQTQAILQINQGLIDIDKAVAQNQQSAEETAKTAAELRKNSANLMDIVNAAK